jgi:hypothetical protein
MFWRERYELDAESIERLAAGKSISVSLMGLAPVLASRGFASSFALEQALSLYTMHKIQGHRHPPSIDIVQTGNEHTTVSGVALECVHSGSG